MNTDKQGVIDMIRKLRAHAENGRTIAEQATFAGKVQQIMDKYRISEAQVAATKDDGKTFIGSLAWIGAASTFTRGDIATFVPLMACTIAKAFACRVIVVEHRAKVHFVGREADRSVAAFMMDYLTRTAVSLAEAAQKRDRRINPSSDRTTFRADFLHGFVCRISERYDETRNTTRGLLLSEGNTEGLVRLERSLVPVDKYLATIDIKIEGKGAAESRPTNIDAAELGVAAAMDQALTTNGIAAPVNNARGALTS